MSEPCLRCGTFLGDERPVRGVALCAPCLEPREIAPFSTLVPERKLAWIWPASLFVPIGVGPGLTLLHHELASERAYPDNVIGFVVLTIIGLWFMAMVTRPLLIERLARRAARPALLERLGVAALTDGLELAFAPLPTRNGLDLGLLARSEGGLAFVGLRGTRVVIPATRIRSERKPSVLRPKQVGPIRANLILELDDRTEQLFHVVPRS